MTENWFPDTPKEEIEQCLNCKKPRCTNCLHDTPTPKNASDSHYKKIDADEFVRTYNDKLRVQDMADTLGVSYISVSRRISWLKVPGRAEDRPKISIEMIECLPDWMQRQFTRKGVPMA